MNSRNLLKSQGNQKKPKTNKWKSRKVKGNEKITLKSNESKWNQKEIEKIKLKTL